MQSDINIAIMGEFKKIIEEYGLTVDDFTQDEIRMALEELEVRKNGEYSVLDGVLDGGNLVMKKLKRDAGISLK